jgi:hypothetical protein
LVDLEVERVRRGRVRRGDSNFCLDMIMTKGGGEGEDSSGSFLISIVRLGAGEVKTLGRVDYEVSTWEGLDIGPIPGPSIIILLDSAPGYGNDEEKALDGRPGRR